MDNSATNGVEHHKISLKDAKGTIRVDKDNHTILKVYARTLKMTITAALHHLLGVGARCFEEKHDQEIKDLEERNRFQARIIVKYIEKYGTQAIKGQ